MIEGKSPPSGPRKLKLGQPFWDDDESQKMGCLQEEHYRSEIYKSF